MSPLRLLRGMLVPLALACQRDHAVSDSSPSVRIIALIPSINDVIVAIGARNRLVGRTDYDRNPAVAALPSVGGTVDPNLEEVIKLHPDLVIVWDDSAAPGLRSKLADLHLRTASMRTSSLEDLRDDVHRIGGIVERQSAADSLWATIDDSLVAVRNDYRRGDRPRVLFVIWTHPLMAAGRGSFIDTLISIAGGRNIFADAAQAWPVVSSELVVARHPDVTLVPISSRAKQPLGSEADIRRSVGGIELGRLRWIDADLIDRPGPRIAEAARQVGRLIHQ
jgi:iron complex transport system substrate-binding protein